MFWARKRKLFLGIHTYRCPGHTEGLTEASPPPRCYVYSESVIWRSSVKKLLRISQSSQENTCAIICCKIFKVSLTILGHYALKRCFMIFPFYPFPADSNLLFHFFLYCLLDFIQFPTSEADLAGLLPYPRWMDKALHLGCCSSSRSASEFSYYFDSSRPAKYV